MSRPCRDGYFVQRDFGFSRRSKDRRIPSRSKEQKMARIMPQFHENHKYVNHINQSDFHDSSEYRGEKCGQETIKTRENVFHFDSSYRCRIPSRSRDRNYYRRDLNYERINNSGSNNNANANHPSQYDFPKRDTDFSTAKEKRYRLPSRSKEKNLEMKQRMKDVNNYDQGRNNNENHYNSHQNNFPINYNHCNKNHHYSIPHYAYTDTSSKSNYSHYNHDDYSSRYYNKNSKGFYDEPHFYDEKNFNSNEGGAKYCFRGNYEFRSYRNDNKYDRTNNRSRHSDSRRPNHHYSLTNNRFTNNSNNNSYYNNYNHYNNNNRYPHNYMSDKVLTSSNNNSSDHFYGLSNNSFSEHSSKFLPSLNPSQNPPQSKTTTIIHTTSTQGPSPLNEAIAFQSSTKATIAAPSNDPHERTDYDNTSTKTIDGAMTNEENVDNLRGESAVVTDIVNAATKRKKPSPSHSSTPLDANLNKRFKSETVGANLLNETVLNENIVIDPSRKYNSVSTFSRDLSPSSVSVSSSQCSIVHIDWKVGSIIKDPIINVKYHLKSLLGDGTFGRVLLADVEIISSSTTTTDVPTDNYDLEFLRRQLPSEVAIKVVRNIPRYVDSAKEEASILKEMTKHDRGSDTSRCVRMFSSFDWEGYYCIVCEVLGPSILDIFEECGFGGFSLDVVNLLCKDTMKGLLFIHGMRLTHTDIKLENVLLVKEGVVRALKGNRSLKHQPKDKSIQDKNETNIDPITTSPARNKLGEVYYFKLIDFGGATFSDAQHTRIINTRQYRAPEVILETAWDERSDIWSLGCLLVESYTGELLFPTHEEREHLAMIRECLDCEPPESLISRANPNVIKDFFRINSRGKKVIDYPTRNTQQESIDEVSAIRSIRRMSLEPKRVKELGGDLQKQEESFRLFADLVEKMLRWDPQDRLSISEYLNHPFLHQRH